jgi:hypothetical protein
MHLTVESLCFGGHKLAEDPTNWKVLTKHTFLVFFWHGVTNLQGVLDVLCVVKKNITKSL